MSFYILLSPTNNLLDISTQELMAYDQGQRVECLDGDIPDLSKFFWNPSTLSFQAKGGVYMTRLEFLRRLTPAERIQAREVAKTDPIVADFFQLIDLAEDVYAGDPDLHRALQYLVGIGVLAPTRVAEIVAVG